MTNRTAGRARVAATLATIALATACPSRRDGAPRPVRAGADVVLERFAFGSCNRQNLPQPLWRHIIAGRPQLWLWLGDNVYADTPDTAVLRASYRMQDTQPDYVALKRQVPIIGTWDDHDYGQNDGGRTWSIRAASQQVALDFLGEPAGTARRAREGLYESYTYGPPGRRVRVILLDTRYHRDPLPAKGATSDGDVLGEAQWKWLEAQLAGSPAQVHVIASSIQVIPEEQQFEKWGNFPRARTRLFELLARTRAPGVVLLSGDRHIAEISRMDVPALGYPVYEVTSSGLTHAYTAARGEPNRYRLGELLPRLNYGTIAFDWSRAPVEITARVHDEADQVRLEQRFAAGQPRR